ncbi:MAG: tripartite tricarboxylate transporter TctB family protein [Alphaproteobacteria bacterium]
MLPRPRNPSDLATGIAFAAIGLGFVVLASEYRLGTARQMGPGYFPTLLGWILAALGALLVARGFMGGSGGIERIAWRKLLVVTLALVLFGLLLRGAGLVPATLVLAVVGLHASERFSWRAALALGAGLALFCWAVFAQGLGLPLSAFGPWLGG